MRSILLVYKLTEALFGDQADEERAAKYPNLTSPHTLKALQACQSHAADAQSVSSPAWRKLTIPQTHVQGIRIRFVAAGSAACHCIVGDMDGKCYTWGRNEVRLISVSCSNAPVLGFPWQPCSCMQCYGPCDSHQADSFCTGITERAAWPERSADTRYPYPGQGSCRH